MHNDALASSSFYIQKIRLFNEYFVDIAVRKKGTRKHFFLNWGGRLFNCITLCYKVKFIFIILGIDFMNTFNSLFPCSFRYIFFL